MIENSNFILLIYGKEVFCLIYLDNAATSWPKPETVYETVNIAFREYGGNPGRGSHKMSLVANELIYEARLLCAKLFHASSPNTICFTLNTTEAINLALKGLLKPGDHVVTSMMEHNAVTRPLKKLEQFGIKTTKVQTSQLTGIDLITLEQAIQENTKLVVCNHISNVTGAVNPVKEIGEICRKKGVLFLLDAAQSAGMTKIDVEEMKIDLLAFPGHKGLMGPQGTGGIYIRNGLNLETLKEGGTGIQSESLLQPKKGPERYESGTMNNPGIAGLAAGLKYIFEVGLENIEKKEIQLTNRLIHGLNSMEQVHIYGPKAERLRGSVVSFTIDNILPTDVAFILDNVFEIAVRAGLHCASDAHASLGTLEMGGVIRISPGYFNTEKEIDQCIDAIKSIIEGGSL